MKSPASLGPSPDPHLDLMRVVRLCHPGWDVLRRVTFSPDAGSTPWETWRTDIFVPLLRPQLGAAFLAAASSDWRGLVACDRALDDSLTPKAAAASRREGAALMGEYEAPVAERLWRRYREMVAAGTSPGHLGIALAVRASAFHFPPPALLSAYVFLEARGGLPGAGLASWIEMTEQCLPGEGSATSPQIKVA